jgi:hypothetical protein
LAITHGFAYFEAESWQSPMALRILKLSLGNHPCVCVFWNRLFAIAGGFVYFEADSWQSLMVLCILKLTLGNHPLAF